MKFSLIIVVFLLSLSIKAQQNQLWFGYYNSVKFSKRFAVNLDYQVRTTQWYEEWSQVLARVGLAYKLSARFTVTGGFADFVFLTKNKLSKNEYRAWQELAAQDQYGKCRVTHRFRAEQRYFREIVNDVWTDRYSFNHRFRYKLEVQRAIWVSKETEKRADVQLANEIMFNTGEVKSYFDQNRISAGVLYTLNRHLAVQLQYMFILQQTNSLTPDQIHVVRFNLYHTIVF